MFVTHLGRPGYLMYMRVSLGAASLPGILKQHDICDICGPRSIDDLTHIWTTTTRRGQKEHLKGWSCSHGPVKEMTLSEVLHK